MGAPVLAKLTEGTELQANTSREGCPIFLREDRLMPRRSLHPGRQPVAFVRTSTVNPGDRFIRFCCIRVCSTVSHIQKICLSGAVRCGAYAIWIRRLCP